MEIKNNSLCFKCEPAFTDHKGSLIYRAAFNDKKGRAIRLIFGLLRGLHV